MLSIEVDSIDLAKTQRRQCYRETNSILSGTPKWIEKRMGKRWGGCRFRNFAGLMSLEYRAGQVASVSGSCRLTQLGSAADMAGLNRGFDGVLQ